MLYDVIEYDKLVHILPLQLCIDEPLGRRAELVKKYPYKIK